MKWSEMYALCEFFFVCLRKTSLTKHKSKAIRAEQNIIFDNQLQINFLRLVAHPREWQCNSPSLFSCQGLVYYLIRTEFPFLIPSNVYLCVTFRPRLVNKATQYLLFEVSVFLCKPLNCDLN